MAPKLPPSKVELLLPAGFVRCDTSTYVYGTAFDSTGRLEPSALARLIKASTDAADAATRLSQLGGFFAVVDDREDSLLLATDRVRSMPLLVRIDEYRIRVAAGTEAHRLVEGSYDVAGVYEFLTSGYSLRQRTLGEGLHSLEAAEVLIVRKDDLTTSSGGTEVLPRTLTSTEVPSFDDFVSVLDLVTRRLIEVAGGRRIYVPLSGGLDSRVIAAMLRRHRYPEVVCFSYGVPGNSESRVSERVAAALSLRWTFAEYHKEDWISLARGSDFGLLLRSLSAASAVPHLQDYLALQAIRADASRDERSLMVPGHSADFLAGSHIPPELIGRPSAAEAIARVVFDRHFVLGAGDISRRWLDDDAVRAELLAHKDVIAGLGLSAITPQDEALHAYERWDMKERQAKFIVNSVRAYEFCGYDWWLPFWDREFLELWQCVPTELRIGKRLYREWVDGLENLLGIPLPASLDKATSSVYRARLRDGELARRCRRVWREFRGRLSPPLRRHHPLAWEGLALGKPKHLPLPTSAFVEGLVGPMTMEAFWGAPG